MGRIYMVNVDSWGILNIFLLIPYFNVDGHFGATFKKLFVRLRKSNLFYKISTNLESILCGPTIHQFISVTFSLSRKSYVNKEKTFHRASCSHWTIQYSTGATIYISTSYYMNLVVNNQYLRCKRHCIHATPTSS